MCIIIVKTSPFPSCFRDNAICISTQAKGKLTWHCRRNEGDAGGDDKGDVLHGAWAGDVPGPGKLMTYPQPFNPPLHILIKLVSDVLSARPHLSPRREGHRCIDDLLVIFFFIYCL